MNILITRPLIDAEDLMGKLFSLGHKIIHLPTLKIIPAKIDPINVKQYNAFIFTSANAVRNLKVIEQDKNKLCFCVGSMTEKIARLKGYNNTISAGGTINALKNLIVNSDLVNEKSKIAYFCGDNISYDLDLELKKDGVTIYKIVNYFSEKITSINESTIELIRKYPPKVIFVYSLRSAESFNSIAANYSLAPMMTHSVVMCISKKIVDFFNKAGWKNNKVFNPGNEIIELEKIK